MTNCLHNTYTWGWLFDRIKMRMVVLSVLDVALTLPPDVFYSSKKSLLHTGYHKNRLLNHIYKFTLMLKTCRSHRNLFFFLSHWQFIKQCSSWDRCLLSMFQELFQSGGTSAYQFYNVLLLQSDLLSNSNLIFFDKRLYVHWHFNTDGALRKWKDI